MIFLSFFICFLPGDQFIDYVFQNYFFLNTETAMVVLEKNEHQCQLFYMCFCSCCRPHKLEKIIKKNITNSFFKYFPLQIMSCELIFKITCIINHLVVLKLLRKTRSTSEQLIENYVFCYVIPYLHTLHTWWTRKKN